nr:hypothetical protein [Bacteroidales bacterium]
MAFLLVCGAFTSCLRSDDLEMLHHPIDVTGSVSPQYGIPVANGEMNINDLLSKLSANYQGLITDDEVVTLEYNANMIDTIFAFSQIPDVAPAHSVAPSAKDGTMWYSKDTVIIDTIDIDFFNDVSEFSGQLDMEHIWLAIAVRAYGECPETVRPYVRATFDNLIISYEDHNGALKPYAGINVDPIQITDITEGFNHSFDTIDIASIANDMPRRLFTQYRLRFNVSSEFITNNIGSMYFGEVLDSVRMSRLIYAADLKVTMPLSIRFNNLTYSFDIDLGDGLSSVDLDSIFSSISEGIEVNIDTARFRMVLDNGIPMAFTLSAKMQDGNGNDLFDIYQNKTIASANTVPDADDPNRYHASSSVVTTLDAILHQAELNMLDEARVMKVTLVTDTDSKHVTIRRDDFLRLKAYLMVRPTVDVNISVTDNGIL